MSLLDARHVQIGIDGQVILTDEILTLIESSDKDLLSGGGYDDPVPSRTTNHNQCTNSGTCSGTNREFCTNTGDCTRTTNNVGCK